MLTVLHQSTLFESLFNYAILATEDSTTISNCGLIEDVGIRILPTAHQ